MARPTDEEIRAKIDTIANDERYHYRTATIVENAPLALIQLHMETEIAALCWVLDVPVPPSRRN